MKPDILDDLRRIEAKRKLLYSDALVRLATAQITVEECRVDCEAVGDAIIAELERRSACIMK